MPDHNANSQPLIPTTSPTMATNTDQLKLDADFESIRDMEPWLLASAAALGFDTDDPAMTAIHLAVHEVATNCVDHATSEGDQLRFSVNRRMVPNSESGQETPALVVEVCDNGATAFAADSVSAPSPAEPQVRGYGLMIAEQVASIVTYERLGDDTLWTNSWTLIFENAVPAQALPEDR